MASLHRNSRFKLRALTSALLVCSMGLAVSSAYALQEITDEDLGESTGEGIAFLPENAYMLFRGAGAGTTESIATMTNVTTGRDNDTGYIRYIPVGPLTNEAATSGAGKADLYLYGLAVSRGDGDLNSRINATGGNFSNAAIRSWGTSANPWLFKVETATNVPNFGPTDDCATTPDNCKVSFLALEAPLYNLTKPTTAATGMDAYNLKLAFWADAFVRDPTKAEGDAAQFQLGGATRPLAPSGTTTRENRLRLQAVWDGLSLNGSRIQLFQTLSGATTGALNGNATNTSYNGTLGLAGLLRFNSGDTQATSSSGYKATISNPTPTLSAAVTTNRFGTLSSCGATPGTGTLSAQCAYRVRSIDTSVTPTGSWTGPSSNVGVLRFSTRETSDTGVLLTPAVNGGNAPQFDASEGLFLYGANMNLVLGSLYQPLVVGTSGNNLVLEVAAIPNKPTIYKQIYTAYAGYTGTMTSGEIATYKGSTCSVYYCGTPIQVNGVNTYQGMNATHSSISIGSTQYDAATNSLTAYNGADAVGVSFGALPNGTVNVAGSTSYFYQIQEQQRRKSNNTSSTLWQYCTTWTGTGGCTTWGATGVAAGLRFDSAGAVWNNRNGTTAIPVACVTGANTTCAGNFTDAGNGVVFNVPATSSIPGASVNAGQWLTTTPAAMSSYALTQAQVGNLAGTQNGFTNLGSAVIDGFLVQHMKITTKGL